MAASAGGLGVLEARTSAAARCCNTARRRGATRSAATNRTAGSGSDATAGTSSPATCGLSAAASGTCDRGGGGWRGG
jgi:hypothetical protein